MAWDHELVYAALVASGKSVGRRKKPAEFEDPFVFLYDQPTSNCAILYAPSCKNKQRVNRPLHMFPGRPDWRQDVLDGLLAAPKPAIEQVYAEKGKFQGWFWYTVEWDVFAAVLGLQVTADVIDSAFQREVREVRTHSQEWLQQKASQFPRLPAPSPTISKAFKRNQYVAAYALNRAAGNCERCSKPAPFLSRKDGTPFLEVHHTIPLSQGGEDTIENVEALCPNCHRKAHYG